MSELKLRQNYPAVASLLGPERFDFLCEQFAKTAEDLSAATELDEYGVASLFPRFVLKSPVHKDFPFLSDLASLELQIVRSTHQAPGTSALSLREMSEQIKQSQILSFALQPYVGLLSSVAPIYSLWVQALEGPRPFSWSPERVLVSRYAHKGAVVRIGEAQYQFLKRLRRGLAWREALGELASEESACSWLADWAELDCFCAG
jgi:hypothetical protein